MHISKAILLFSEGLDSTLAGLILKRENIKVIAVRFITPFFGWKYKKNPEIYQKKCQALGFDEAYVFDVTREYLEILKKPKFGYGDYANPCIDCKIFFLKKAKSFMEKFNADFIATGEVLGQRPMSQNKTALERIEKEAGVEGMLLRPLSAKLLKETEPEIKGLINREHLYAHRGRQRNFQLELAKAFDLKEIPTPAGGCLLTDQVIGSRVLKIIKERRTLTPLTAELLTFGKHYFEKDLWLILGRNKEENQRLIDLAKNLLPLYTLSEPSPVASIIEGKPDPAFIKNLLFQHSKKAQKKEKEGGKVELLPL
ncbi:MAG: tRNA 4-thiouridine(8) synthase ThiI [Caldimicrobium sp.]